MEDLISLQDKIEKWIYQEEISSNKELKAIFDFIRYEGFCENYELDDLEKFVNDIKIEHYDDSSNQIIDQIFKDGRQKKLYGKVNIVEEICGLHSYIDLDCSKLSSFKDNMPLDPEIWKFINSDQQYKNVSILIL